MTNAEGNKGSAGLKDWIRAEAFRLGFSHCGFARNGSLEELRPFYDDFILRKGHAGLGYLETHLEKRLRPELVMEGAKTIIAFLMNYFPQELIPEDNNFIISKYAYGNDYHVVIRNRMKELINFLQSLPGNLHAKGFVDSGVVAEKAWAQKCGVGWQGKNTVILNKPGGSFFFIGILLLEQEIEPDMPATDHCGDCRNCVTACPTGALDAPYQLDIRRCISYLTIETKGEIPADLKSKLNDRIYGCDICQDVCPYNRFAKPHQSGEFFASLPLMKMRKPDWVALTEPEFDRIFSNSPVKRIGYQRLMRNIRAAAGQ